MKRAESSCSLPKKRGTIFCGTTIPDGLHPNFHKLPRHLLVARYQNRVNRINRVDRTHRHVGSGDQKAPGLARHTMRFLNGDFLLKSNTNTDGGTSELFGSLAELKGSLNKMDLGKPVALSSGRTDPKKLSYSRMLGKVQSTRQTSPDAPPNSRVEQ
eukprot:sb/3473123/